MNIFKKIYNWISLKQRLSQKLNMNVVKVTFSCNGHFNHEHKHEAMAILCGRLQWLLHMHVLHFTWMRIFNKEKLLRIKLAMQGSNKRALKRRIKRGESAI